MKSEAQKAREDYVESRLVDAIRTARFFANDGPKPVVSGWTETLREFQDVWEQALATGRYQAMTTRPSLPSPSDIKRAEVVLFWLAEEEKAKKLKPREVVLLTGAATLHNYSWRWAKLAKSPQMRDHGWHNRKQIAEAYRRTLETVAGRAFEAWDDRHKNPLTRHCRYGHNAA